jgi:hypothetical protein
MLGRARERKEKTGVNRVRKLQRLLVSQLGTTSYGRC